MPDYQKLYILLFNAITVALEDMEKHNYGAAQERLVDAQIRSEALYNAQTEGGLPPISSVFPHPFLFDGSGEK